MSSSAVNRSNRALRFRLNAMPNLQLFRPFAALQLIFLATTADAADDEASSAVPPEPPIIDADRDHWAYRPLQSVTPPDLQRTDWCRTPIDQFILAELEGEGLSPAPAADRVTLLRRVTFDLTGLPPTPREIDAFLADTQPLAYERVVDRLLASRAYGEHAAQAWLDLARFAETDGFEHDLVRPNAWRYRDWVIAAFNADMPYDEFVRLQLAGDELRPGDANAAIATGFLLAGPDMPDINLQEERRHTFLNNLTSTVGSVFMGLQFECAACHDHKYDPISQFDFYRLRAFFEPADLFREHPIPLAQDEAALAEFQSERDRRWLELEAEIARLRDGDPDQNAARIAELDAELKKVKTSTGPPLPMGRVVHEQGADPRPSYLWLRGDFRRPGPEVEPAFLRVVTASSEAVPPPEQEAASSGRRTALARWLTKRDHPLTTRVIVNRIWQQHFGRGLVETSSDFGFMGDTPTHPELLDWLAAELPRQGWSLKQLHRLMVTSAVYRSDSRLRADPASPEGQAWQTLVSADPGNELLGRMRRRRLQGEEIRDSLLAVCSELSDASHGPGVRPPLPDEVVETLLRDQWPVTPEADDHHRRSIYLFVRRNLRFPLFEVFDRPDSNLSCARRNESTTAPQALHMLNGPIARDCAGQLAVQLREAYGDDDDAMIAAVYRRALARLPSQAEQEAAARFLDAAHPEDGLADLCLAILNLNEFLYVD